MRAHLEGLTAVCERFKKGKEAYARAVASDLLQSFLEVEERFCSSADHSITEQEVIDGLRQVLSLKAGLTCIFK